MVSDILLFGVPIAAFLLTAGLLKVSIRMFPRWGLLDFPERYGLMRARLPYPAGIVAVFVFLLFALTVLTFTTQLIGLLVGIVILAIYCFVDDRKALPAWMRLAIQVLVAVIIFVTGSRIYTITNPLEGIAGFSQLIKLDSVDLMTPGLGPLPVLSGIFTILWLGLTINALNWFDGIPGQVSALSVIGFLTIGFLSVSDRVNQPSLALIAFVLAAIALACFLFDKPAPRVLLGDTGAMFFGLMLGALTIYAGGKVATGFLVIGVPLIDSFLVIVRRLIKRKSIFKGNRTDEHLHHRLLAIGWSEKKIISLTVVLGTLFGISALFFSTREKFFAAVILLFIMISLGQFSKAR